MSRKFISGFETGSILEMYDAANDPSACDIATNIKRTGAYSGRIFPVTTSTGYFKFRNAGGATDDYAKGTSFAADPLYARIYVYIDTAPTATEDLLIFFSTHARLSYRLTSSRTVAVYDTTDGAAEVQPGTLMGTSAAAIPLQTWTMVSCMFNNGAWEVRIGTESTSGAGGTYTGTISDVFVGKYFNNNGSGYDIYVDDVAVDNATWPGEGQVKILLPSGNSATDTGWTASAGEKWACIDELPYSATEGDYIYCATANQAYCATMQSVAEAGIDAASYNGIQVHLVQKQATDFGPKVRIRTPAGTFNIAAAEIDDTTTYNSRFRVYATDPNDAAAWSDAKLDGLELGLVQYNGTNECRCLNLGCSVEYIPNEAPPAGGTPYIRNATYHAKLHK